MRRTGTAHGHIDAVGAQRERPRPVAELHPLRDGRAPGVDADEDTGLVGDPHVVAPSGDALWLAADLPRRSHTGALRIDLRDRAVERVDHPHGAGADRYGGRAIPDADRTEDPTALGVDLGNRRAG